MGLLSEKCKLKNYSKSGAQMYLPDVLVSRVVKLGYGSTALCSCSWFPMMTRRDLDMSGLVLLYFVSCLDTVWLSKENHKLHMAQ